MMREEERIESRRIKRPFISKKERRKTYRLGLNKKKTKIRFSSRTKPMVSLVIIEGRW